MARFILVHGACHGAWCWEKLVPLLVEKGHSVETIDLPGSGADRTAPDEVTFEGFVERIVAQVSTSSEPAVLVGHSMAGAAISQAAETCHPLLTKLIYLCAVLPVDGESFVDLLATTSGFSDADAPEVWETGADGTMFPKREQVLSAFYHRCDPQDARAAIARLRPQSLKPFATPVSLSASGWGRVPKCYIICSDDQIVPPRLQHWFVERVPGVKAILLDSDHSAFYSATADLGEILEEEAVPDR